MVRRDTTAIRERSRRMAAPDGHGRFDDPTGLVEWYPFRVPCRSIQQPNLSRLPSITRSGAVSEASASRRLLLKRPLNLRIVLVFVVEVVGIGFRVGERSEGLKICARWAMEGGSVEPR